MSVAFLNEDIGNRTPSQFLRHLKFMEPNICGTSEVLLKCLWLRRLPNQVQMILASMQDKSLEEQARAADAIMEVMEQSEKESAVVSYQPQLNKLFAEVQKLKVAVEKLTQSQSYVNHNMNSQTRGRSRARSSSRRPGRSASRTRGRRSESRTSNGRILCWYHEKFGHDAHYCTYPCSFDKH